jgi:hypothetical protein
MRENFWRMNMPKKTSKSITLNSQRKEKLQRYRVMSDNDGHKYIVPENEEAEFEAWVIQEDSGGLVTSLFREDFRDMRVNTAGWTFTDPQGWD